MGLHGLVGGGGDREVDVVGGDAHDVVADGSTDLVEGDVGRGLRHGALRQLVALGERAERGGGHPVDVVGPRVECTGDERVVGDEDLTGDRAEPADQLVDRHVAGHVVAAELLGLRLDRRPRGDPGDLGVARLGAHVVVLVGPVRGALRDERVGVPVDHPAVQDRSVAALLADVVDERLAPRLHEGDGVRVRAVAGEQRVQPLAGAVALSEAPHVGRQVLVGRVLGHPGLAGEERGELLGLLGGEVRGERVDLGGQLDRRLRDGGGAAQLAGSVDRGEGTDTRLLSGDGLALAHDLGDLAVRVGGVSDRVPRTLPGRAVVHEAVAVAVDRARTGDNRLILVVPRVGLGPVGQLAVVVHGVEPVGQQRLLTFPARPHGSAPSHAANTVGSM